MKEINRIKRIYDYISSPSFNSYKTEYIIMIGANPILTYVNNKTTIPPNIRHNFKNFSR